MLEKMVNEDNMQKFLCEKSGQRCMEISRVMEFTVEDFVTTLWVAKLCVKKCCVTKLWLTNIYVIGVL
jgi:hypothetical protein